MSMLTRKRDVPREVAVQPAEDGRAETHHAESMPESRESVERRVRIIESMMKAFDESVADRKKTAIGDTHGRMEEFKTVGPGAASRECIDDGIDAMMDLDIKLHYGVDGPIGFCYQDLEVPELSCARSKKTLHRSAHPKNTAVWL